MKYLIRVNHPTLPVITNFFAAFNEEKGEKSIHDAFRYIHNSDYSYENLDSHYRMLPLMKSADEIFQINSNYKSSNDGYKFCNLDLNTTITPSDDRNMLISSAFINIIEKMDSNQYSPFVRQKHCYYVDGQTIDNNYSSELDATITAFLQKKKH